MAEVVLLIVLSLGAVYLIGHLIAFEYGRDQAIYAVVADGLLQGKAPYQGVWDFKPPGIYFFYALSRMSMGVNMHAVRVLEALGVASLFYAFIILSKRHVGSGRAGVVSGVAAVFGYVSLDFWHTAQPESLGAVVLAWAIVCATYSPATEGRSRVRLKQLLSWAGAAALYSIAALLKPPLGGGILVSLLLILVKRKRSAPSRSNLKRFSPPVLAFTVGAAVPILAVLTYLAGKGALDDMYEALFIFAPKYTRLGIEQARFPVLLLKTFNQWLFQFSPFIVIGFVPLLVLPSLHVREREGLLHVLGAITFSLLGVALQAKFFHYHFAASVTLAALPAGWGIWKFWIRVRHTILGWLATGLILAAASVGWIPGLPYARNFWEGCRARIDAFNHPSRRQSIYDRIYSMGDLNAGANRLAALWISTFTSPDDRIYVWGFEPILYVLTGRKPASRYIYNVPQRVSWGVGKARKILLEELKSSMPASIVLLRNDALPWVTGSHRDSRSVLETFPQLFSWIKESYQYAETIEDLEIWIRKTDGQGF